MRIAFQNSDQQIPLFCESIGYHWPQTLVNRPKGYYAYHWLQSETGSGIISMEQQTIHLAPHQAILIRPGVTHRYHPFGNDQWQTAFLAFSGSIADELMGFLKLDKFLFFDHLNPELDAYISQTYDHFVKDNLLAALDQSAAIYRFIMLIKQNNYFNDNQFTDQAIITPILHYLTSHFDISITNQALSAVTGYSVPYQNRIFRQKYGQSPLQYLADYRLREAKELLILHPAWSVQKIGNLVGFNDISRFIHQFKSRYQFTPNQFRKVM